MRVGCASCCESESRLVRRARARRRRCLIACKCVKQCVAPTGKLVGVMAVWWGPQRERAEETVRAARGSLDGGLIGNAGGCAALSWLQSRHRSLRKWISLV